MGTMSNYAVFPKAGEAGEMAEFLQDLSAGQCKFLLIYPETDFAAKYNDSMNNEKQLRTMSNCSGLAGEGDVESSPQPRGQRQFFLMN